MPRTGKHTPNFKHLLHKAKLMIAREWTDNEVDYRKWKAYLKYASNFHQLMVATALLDFDEIDSTTKISDFESIDKLVGYAELDSYDVNQFILDFLDFLNDDFFMSLIYREPRPLDDEEDFV